MWYEILGGLNRPIDALELLNEAAGEIDLRVEQGDAHVELFASVPGDELLVRCALGDAWAFDVLRSDTGGRAS